MDAQDYLMAGNVAVAGALAAVMRWIQNRVRMTEKQLENCEAQHKAAGAELAALREKIGFLEGRQEGSQALAKEILTLMSIQLKEHEKHIGTHESPSSQFGS